MKLVQEAPLEQGLTQSDRGLFGNTEVGVARTEYTGCFKALGRRNEAFNRGVLGL